jgi:hypothetical protein
MRKMGKSAIGAKNTFSGMKKSFAGILCRFFGQ